MNHEKGLLTVTHKIKTSVFGNLSLIWEESGICSMLDPDRVLDSSKVTEIWVPGAGGTGGVLITEGDTLGWRHTWLYRTALSSKWVRNLPFWLWLWVVPWHWWEREINMGPNCRLNFAWRCRQSQSYVVLTGLAKRGSGVGPCSPCVMKNRNKPFSFMWKTVFRGGHQVPLKV